MVPTEGSSIRRGLGGVMFFFCSISSRTKLHRVRLLSKERIHVRVWVVVAKRVMSVEIFRFFLLFGGLKRLKKLNFN